MRLHSVALVNFRCYRDELVVDFADFTALVGRNDVGKSSILEAIAIFFDSAKIDQSDVSIGADGPPSITCEFTDLPDAVVLDADFVTDLGTEHLLNSDRRLTIRKSYSGAGLKATVEIIAHHPTAEGVNDLLLLKRSELVERANQRGVEIPPGNANAPLRSAIWASAHDLQLAKTSIQVDKEGAKQIWVALQKYMPLFALFKSDRESSDQDPEAQDPLKAAIKEALSEIIPQLEEIQERVRAQVQKIANDTVEKIRELDASIAETLSPIVTPKKWDTLFSTSLTGDEGVPINKRGSGVRRLVLLSFFRAQSEQAVRRNSSTSVIYAIEEPETSQHPHNQRMLLAALRELASSGRQIIITTHTPTIAKSLPVPSLRLITKENDAVRRIASPDDQQLNGKISESLGVLPDHSVRAFIGVEGPHDISFLRHVSRAFLDVGVAAPNLGALELAGKIIFVPMGGSNLALWTSRLKELDIPEVHICDRDNEPPAGPKYEQHIAEVNLRPGCRGFHTSRREMENYVHPDAIAEAYADNGIAVVLPDVFQPFDDVPDIVARAVHAATSTDPWPIDDEKARKKRSKAKVMINSTAMEKMTAARFEDVDPTLEVLQWLQPVTDAIGD